MTMFYKQQNSKQSLIDSRYKTVDNNWHYIKNAYYKTESDNEWHPAYLYDWVPSEWGKCSVTCGSGTQSRTVKCVRNDGVLRDDCFCKGISKPSLVQECNTQPCIVINDEYCAGLDFDAFTDFAYEKFAVRGNGGAWELGTFTNTTGIEQKTLFINMSFGNYDINGYAYCDISVDGGEWMQGYCSCAGPPSPIGWKGACHAQGELGCWCTFPDERRNGDNYTIWKFENTFPKDCEIRMRFRTYGFGYSGRTIYFHRPGPSQYLWA